MLEHLTDTLVGLGGALKVLESTNLLANFLTLHFDDWSASIMGKSHGRLEIQGRGDGGSDGGGLTSSGETGFWLVLRSSSMVF